MSAAKPGQKAAPAQPKPWLRVLGLIGATLLTIGLALIYPLVARGERWLEVEWRHWWVLVLLAVIPPLWWWGTLGQDGRRPRLKIGTLVPLRQAPRGVRTRLRDLPGVFNAVAVGLFIVALAGPILVLSDQTTDEKGIDIMIVMDLSGSMQAVLDADRDELPEDFQLPKNRRPTRLDTAKLVVRDFIARRKTDRIGAVVFGRSAYILSPPTLDYKLLDKLIGKLELSVIDGSKTALGDALGTAVARLRRSDALSKTVIVLTDGLNNAGKISPELAIDGAVAHNAKVYTIQIGDGAEVDVLKGYTRFGQPVYQQERHPTDPALLQRIAQRTGGKYFVATDAQGLRQSMHEILDTLEKTRFEASIAHHEDLFVFLLLPGVVLLGAGALLRALLLRRFP